MGDYQPLHESQHIHRASAESQHGRADTIPLAEAVAYARSALVDLHARLASIGIDQHLDTAFTEVLAGLDPEQGDYGDPGGDSRHRRFRRESPAGKVLPLAIDDLPDQKLRPDPGKARTAAEFLCCLRDYRVWAGNPSYRVMSRQCGHRFAASTICTALRSRTVPSLEMVLAIISACGGSEQHQREFASAWRRLLLPAPRHGGTAVPRSIAAAGLAG